MKKSTKTLDYGTAYQELEKILAGIEQGEINVDQLSAQVQRAAELIGFCQSRLKEAEVEVKKVVDRFEQDAEEETGD